MPSADSLQVATGRQARRVAMKRPGNTLAVPGFSYQMPKAAVSVSWTPQHYRDQEKSLQFLNAHAELDAEIEPENGSVIVNMLTSIGNLVLGVCGIFVGLMFGR